MSGCLDRVVVSIAIAGLASGCGRVKAPAGSGIDGGGGGSLTVSSDPDHLIVQQGASQMVQVTVSGQDASEDVTVELTGLPDGVSADPVTLPAGQRSATMTITAAASAGQGASDLMLAASTGGGLDGQAPMRLLVGGPPGTPDQSFAQSGTFTAQAGGATTVGRGLAVLDDGRIVVTGGTATQAFTVRLGDDGTLDATFGNGGRVLTGGIGGDPDAEGIVVARAADGRVVVGGTTGDYMASHTAFALFAYDDGGQLDTGFGTAGLQTIDFGSGFAEIHALVTDDGGNLTAVGSQFATSTVNHMVRYNGAGQEDSAFAPPAESDAGAEAALIDSNGKLVVAGTIGGDLWIERYGADGSPDTTFGTGGTGRTLVDLSGNDVAFGVNELAGGKLLVVGLFNSNGSDSKLCLARLLADGTPDDSLAAGGALCTTLAFGTSAPGASVVDDQGRIVVVGHDDNSDAPGFAVVRLLPDGSPDTSFAGTGMTILDFGVPATGGDGAYGVALDPDGRIVVSGTVGPSTGQSLAVVRLWP